MVIIFLVLALLLGEQEIRAQYATEFTQVLNNIQLVQERLNQIQMLANQVIQIQNQVQQLNSVATYTNSWGQISAVAGSVNNIITESQNIANLVNQAYSNMQNSQPNLANSNNLIAQENNWRTGASQSVSGALSTVNLQTQSINQENQELQLLLAKNNGAIGETQALQTLNVLMAQMINQMQLLRQLTQAQINLQSAYINQQISKEQEVDNNVDQMVHTYSNEASSYSISNGF